jgi:putative oxidoreductase
MTKIHKIIPFAHAVLSVLLAVFFLNAGVKKFTPKPLRPVEEKELVQQIIIEQSYAPPLGYKLTMNTMRQSGFLKMIGVFQLLAGILMLIPRFRLVGLLLLLPIILNIFTIHVFMDNRAHENMETGTLLLATLLLISYYYRRLLPLFGKVGSVPAEPGK